jgi:tetratricopeptide (TPR) repeat protein
MKPILLFITLFLSICSAFAQSAKTDDALLLDYYQTQRFAEAADYLKRIYPEPITDSKALSRLAYTSLMAGKLTDAEGFYQRIYDADSTNTAVLYNMASINQRRGNANRAELFYKRIILRDTTDFQVYKQLAAITHNKGNIIGEIVYLQKANTLNPLEFDVASDLSDLYVNLKQFPQAEKVLTVAIVADPENVILLQSLLKLSYAQKKWTVVIKVGEQLLQLADESQRLKLGIAYYNTKNYLCGLESLLPVPELLQNETTAYFTAACYKLLKDQKTAILFFKKAIKLSLSPTTATYYNEMADSHQQLAQLTTAESMFKKALLYDQQSMTYYSLAVLYDTKMKSPKNALLYYKKYLDSKPEETEKDQIAYSKSRIAALSVH